MSLQNGSLDSTNALIQLILAQWNPSNVPYTQANNGQGTLTIGQQGTILTPQTQQIINGGFENGSSPWLGSDIVSSYAHSGTYSDELVASADLLQYITIDLTKVTVNSLTFWAYTTSNSNNVFGSLYVFFTDGSSTSFMFNHSNLPANTWTQFNPTATLFPSSVLGKTVSYISFYCSPTSVTFYVDDVSLLTSTQYNPDLLIQIDEYQPLQSRYQIVFKEGNPRTIYEAPNVYRIEQGIVLELHVRPIRFDPDNTITAQRLIFEQIKQEIQRILNTYRYDSLFSNTVGGVTTTYASTIEMRGWGQEPLPHGFGRQKEPVEMVSRLGLTIIYYECDGTPVAYIGDRVVSVSCLGNTFTGLVTAEWEDMDQWVMIKIPKGPVIEQGLIGPHVDGKVFVKDWRGLALCLMATQIPENTGHYPVNSDNSKTVFSVSGNEWSITIRDSSPQPSNTGTKLLVFWFTNVRIKQIKQVKASAQGGIMEPQWEIDWMADTYTQPTLN